jgi:hypothetical protein
MTWSAVQLAIPDRSGWSAHSKCTVTLLLFHPFRFGAGESIGVIVGGVRSIPTFTTWCVSSLPALSTDQNSSVWSPSLEIETLVPVCVAPPSTV